jgi:hypothetical protein
LFYGINEPAFIAIKSVGEPDEESRQDDIENGYPSALPLELNGEKGHLQLYGVIIVF